MKKLKYTTKEFIDKARLIHGGKYDYSISKYAGCQTPLKIKCGKSPPID